MRAHLAPSFVTVMTVATAAFVLAGCSDQPVQKAQAEAAPAAAPAPVTAQPAPEPAAAAPSAPDGDAQSRRGYDKAIDIKDSELLALPVTSFPAARPMEVVNAVYGFAARHPEVLSKVPCFCGCERMGHRGNDDCFVKARDARGRPTAWEEHGLG